MLILGIDPGTATTGFGLIKIMPGDLIPIHHGLIETKKHHSPEKRLKSIHDQLMVILEKYKPNVMAIEKIFFATNAKTAIRVGQAQGIMFYAAAVYDIPVVEYAPGTIKKWVAGHGRSDKAEVQEAVKNILGKHITYKKGKKTHFDNEADALAVALCHIFKSNEHDFESSMYLDNV